MLHERTGCFILHRPERGYHCTGLCLEEGAVQAFQAVIALDKAQELLERDISVVDFRNPKRPVLRRGDSGIDGLFETEFILGEEE